MKLFHLSDLHIGLKLMNRDLREDQEFIFSQILDLARLEQPDAVLIAGDIYDKAVPSAEAVECFDHFLSGLTEAVPKASVMMISGNHDSGPRVNCFRSVLSRQGVYMIGLPPQKEGERIEKVTLQDTYGPVHFYLLPFVKPSMVRELAGTDENGNSLSYEEMLRRLFCRETIDPSARNVLVSHQFYLPVGKRADEVERMDSEIRTVGNIDGISAKLLEPFDYAALGHIHKPMKVSGETRRYCGTPLACSVSEAGQKKYVVMAELKEKGRIEVSELPLTPLREIRVIKGTLREVLEQGCGDYVTAVLTDRNDLDILDMQDRLRSAFPFLLEIRRETGERPAYEAAAGPEQAMDPFGLCCSFLKETDEREQEILRDVINQVREETGCGH